MALLVAALMWVDEPGYSALILRRTYKQLAKADSILNKAKEWLIGRANQKEEWVHWNGDDKKFTFPSGATIEFGHIEHEDAKLNYQGGAWSFIGVDECTQFTESMISYPRTRQRRPVDSKIPVRWRGASNPGGIGHDYIKGRYVKDPNGKNPCTPDRQFFPARLEDNPHIDREDYLKQLRESGIDPLTLAQLERGDWDAVAGGRFQRSWFGSYNRDPHSPDFVQVWRKGELVERFKWTDRLRFQTCDPAASTSSAADYFVLSTWLITPKANVLWWACERDKLELPDQVLRCQESYRRHKPAFVAIEEVLNQRGLAQTLRRSTNPIMVVRGVTPGGKKKLEHAIAGIVLASTERLYLPSDNPMFPHDDVVSELTRFTGNEDLDANDDIVDTVSYMAELLPGLQSMATGSGQGPRVGTMTDRGARR